MPSLVYKRVKMSRPISNDSVENNFIIYINYLKGLGWQSQTFSL